MQELLNPRSLRIRFFQGVDIKIRQEDQVCLWEL